MLERHVWTLAAIPFLVLLAQAPARASAPSGLEVRIALVTGAGLPSHALVTTGVTAPAAHTSSRAHLRTRHHAHHRPAHRHPVADRGALQGTLPARGTPARHGVDHRSAVPATLTRGHRVPTTYRQGMILPPAAWAGTMVRTSRLEPEPGRSIARLEGRTISGRGPPRGASSADCRPPRATSFPATAALPLPTVPTHLESAARPRTSRLAPGGGPASYRPGPWHEPWTTPRPSRDRDAAPAGPIGPAPPFLAASPATVTTESVLDRSLARRPEGATACFDPPSSGDSP